ncbi:MAG: tautomerase family protein [Aminipila sp.]
MPHISLTLYKGRSLAEREYISKTLQKCLMEAVGWKAEDISVSLEQVAADEFVLTVRDKMKFEELIIPSDFIK